MGSNWSSMDREPSPDLWWPTAQTRSDTVEQNVGEERAVENPEQRERERLRLEELEVFKQELAQKRAIRQEALAALQSEMKELRRRVEEERALRVQAEEERDKFKGSAGEQLRRELEKERDEKDKLLEERERLMEEVEEKNGLQRQIQALKDVSEIGKEMLRIRELQVKELKKKLVEINLSSVMAPPEDLKVEYEKQIDNIRKLRTLYEERAAATLLEHRRELEREEARIAVLETKLSDLQKETDECQEAKKELEGKIENLESAIQHKENELENTKDDLFSSTVQNKSLNSQMTLINHLFSQMLVSPKVDLDRLTRLLKENRGLITDLTEKGDSNEVAALLVDLAGQIEKEQEDTKKPEQTEVFGENNTSQPEIASNLSKVWRVMVELLSHQNPSHTELAGGAESCYKCIQTPSGPRSVISVSQTFLTLKDLILEKNRLVKEVGRLKTLNSHLEHRLGSQEKRLSVVTTELRKTWGVVNKLKAQHKQLHTHEKILRYELQQKRCMLTELKQELEHCRDKWERARQKNTQTEEDWKKLRKEFAARKTRKESNSAESGYEEEDAVPSPASESISHGEDLFKIRSNEGIEPELSEEEIEHSDGNSFDTVIDLLDIACLESQTEGGSGIPFVLCEVASESPDISPTIQPLTGSEFTEGLDQIESPDLAAVLDIQYQNQLLGADYNLSLPSSSGSSPIPTENDDFASSEMEISEEDSSPHDNHVYSSPLPSTTQSVSEGALLFGSNSSKNISKFLDGLFAEKQETVSKTPSQNLFLNIPSTSQTGNETDSATPLVSNKNCYQFSCDSATPLVNENCYEFPVNSNTGSLQDKTEKAKLKGMEHVQQWVVASQTPLLDGFQDQKETCDEPFAEQPAMNPSSQFDEHTQEEALQAREHKLKKLEQQCRSLVSKVTSTSFRSEVISNKLDELHRCYGSSGETSDIEGELAEREINLANIECESNNNQPTEINLCCGDSTAVSDTTEQSSHASNSVRGRTTQSILEARAARLKRLEDQCKSLFSKMSATSSRSDLISNKLDELHGSYGPSEDKLTEQPSTSSIRPSTTTQSLEEDECTYNKNHSDENQAVNKKVIKDSRPPDLSAESKDVLNKCSLPGPSVEPIAITKTKKGRTPEEILEARAERFKRLEEQCKSLVSKMTATSLRSEIISNKLDELHSCYGSSEDTSDNDEHSSSSKDDDRKNPTTSPRYNRKIARLAEKEKQTDLDETQVKASVSGHDLERVLPSPVAISESESKPHSDKETSNQSKKTPEDILQARAQRLNRLEEQCKSLFTKMSATSQRSDVISNRLEELHEHYGPSTSEQEEQSTSELTRPGTSTDTDVTISESNANEVRSGTLTETNPSDQTSTNERIHLNQSGEKND